MITTIHTWEHLVAEMQELASNKTAKGFLYLSTYGLTKNDKAKDMLTALKPTKMLIGTSARECKAGCRECITANYLKSANIQEFKALSDFKVKITDTNHLKLMVTAKGVIIGGINLTESAWTDSAVLIKDKATIKKFKEYFEKAWEESEDYEYSQKGKSYVFTFGKYAGLTFHEVKRAKPDYIEWCFENLDWFKNEMKLLKIKK